jgi:transposase InsO family protein
MGGNIIGLLPESRTYNVVVTIIDTHTKVIKLELVNITISAMGVAIIMRDHVYQEEGLPAKVYSDQGPQFISQFMKEFYMLVRIERNPSTAYHPQTDSQTERMNQEVEKYLQMFTSHQQNDWSEWLLLTEFTYNNLVNESTRTTPFFLNKGQHLHALPTNPLTEPNTPASPPPIKQRTA